MLLLTTEIVITDKGDFCIQWKTKMTLLTWNLFHIELDGLFVTSLPLMDLTLQFSLCNSHTSLEKGRILLLKANHGCSKFQSNLQPSIVIIITHIVLYPINIYKLVALIVPLVQVNLYQIIDNFKYIHIYTQYTSTIIHLTHSARPVAVRWLEQAPTPPCQ